MVLLCTNSTHIYTTPELSTTVITCIENYFGSIGWDASGSLSLLCHLLPPPRGCGGVPPRSARARRRWRVRRAAWIITELVVSTFLFWICNSPKDRNGYVRKLGSYGGRPSRREAIWNIYRDILSLACAEPTPTGPAGRGAGAPRRARPADRRPQRPAVGDARLCWVRPREAGHR